MSAERRHDPLNMRVRRENPLDVPLVIQPDDKTCGQCNVSMIAQYFGKDPIPINDPIFKRLRRKKDTILDSFGVGCALLSIFKTGNLFFASDSMTKTFDVHGVIYDLKPDEEKRRQELLETMTLPRLKDHRSLECKALAAGQNFRFLGKFPGR